MGWGHDAAGLPQGPEGESDDVVIFARGCKKNIALHMPSLIN